jgi:ATP-binding cassette subfamily B protein
MQRNDSKYKMVYSHLWSTYGSSWPVRISYVLQIFSRIFKLIFLPVALSLVISRLSAQDFDGATEAVFWFVMASLLVGILTPLVKYVGMLGENKVYAASTAKYFHQLIQIDIDYFNSNLSGYVTTATKQYVDSCVLLVRALRDQYINTILSIVFPLIVIIWVDVWLGLIALGVSVVQGVYVLWASHAIDPLRTKAREIYKTNAGRMSDAISNILAVRSAAQEMTYAEQVGEGAKREAKAFFERYKMQAKLIAGREMITVVFFAVLLLLTVERLSGGYIDMTTAVLVITYITTILTGIYSLSEGLDAHDDLIDKIIPAFDVLNRKNSITNPAQPVELGVVKGEICLKEVSFSYHDQGTLPVFEDFSLDIQDGQKIGVVGLSGAGKSTLTKLLLRFIDVEKGAILLDGKDIRSFRQTDLRRSIAYVPQEPLLFHSSIRENILLARPDASAEELRHALETAHAAHFVNHLEDGIESVVGERGVKLSGGQKQRIAIARAVLQNAPIMILDEATSALDSESEQIIKNSFSEILQNKTAIVVAHRLSTLSEMDRIIVIENGKLVEDGNHESLLAANGRYARLWNKQQRNVED